MQEIGIFAYFKLLKKNRTQGRVVLGALQKMQLPCGAEQCREARLCCRVGSMVRTGSCIPAAFPPPRPFRLSICPRPFPFSATDISFIFLSSFLVHAEGWQ